MHPDNKKFLSDMIDQCPVSVHEPTDGMSAYVISLPDGETLTVSALITELEKNKLEVYYAAGIDEPFEEAFASISQKTPSPDVKDFLDILRKCSAKVILQETHKLNSKLMVRHIANKRHLS